MRVRFVFPNARSCRSLKNVVMPEWSTSARPNSRAAESRVPFAGQGRGVMARENARGIASRIGPRVEGGACDLTGLRIQRHRRSSPFRPTISSNALRRKRRRRSRRSHLMAHGTFILRAGQWAQSRHALCRMERDWRSTDGASAAGGVTAAASSAPVLRRSAPRFARHHHGQAAARMKATMLATGNVQQATVTCNRDDPHECKPVAKRQQGDGACERFTVLHTSSHFLPLGMSLSAISRACTPGRVSASRNRTPPRFVCAITFGRRSNAAHKSASTRSRNAFFALRLDDCGSGAP